VEEGTFLGTNSDGFDGTATKKSSGRIRMSEE
jgi:hypothetical protein